MYTATTRVWSTSTTSVWLRMRLTWNQPQIRNMLPWLTITAGVATLTHISAHDNIRDCFSKRLPAGERNEWTYH
jgi:hypothetical protein